MRIVGRQREAAELFERIAVGDAMSTWSIVGAPRESLRATPRRSDLLIVRKPGATGVLEVLGTAGDWLLVEDDSGRYWAPVLDRGRLREDFAIARQSYRLAEQPTPPAPPVLDKDTPVTLPDATALPALRTQLRLDNVAPTTRTFLSAIVLIAGAHPGVDAMKDIKTARDDLSAAVTANTVPKSAAAATKQVIASADVVLGSSARYDEIVGLATLVDVDKLSGADAMTKLASGHDAIKHLLDRVEKIKQLATRAKTARKQLDKAKAAALTANADTLDRVATAATTWLRAVVKGRPWSKELRKFVAAKRPGGRLDSEHLTRFKYTDTEVTTTTRFSEWDLIDASEVFGSTAKTLTSARIRPALTNTIRAAFSAAFRSGKAASPPDSIVNPCVDAIVTAFPLLVDDRDALAATARALITLVANDLGAASADTALQRVNAALAVAATEAFAKELLAAADLWPFDKKHYLDRAMKAFDSFTPGFDIFDLVANHLVNYNFFGQDLIQVSEDLVAPLEQAERHYFGIRTQFPDTSFVVARETGAFNFRLAREKVMRVLLHRQAKGFFVHTVGRGIDVNYPDARNPHVTQPKDIWLPVNDTLVFAGLAPIDFTANGKEEDTLYEMLAASRQFTLSFSAWESAAPQAFAVPQTGWPTAAEYKRALAAADLDGRARPIRDAVNARDAAVAAEKKARAKLMSNATATEKVWRENFKKLRARQKRLIEKGDGVSQMMRLRISMLAAKDAEVHAVDDALDRLTKALANKKDRTPDVAVRATDVVSRADAARTRLENLARAQQIDLSKLDVDVARKRARWTSMQDYFEGMVALLPKSATAVTDARKELASAVRKTDDAKADPLLVKFVAGQRELRVVTAYNAYKKIYKRWAKQGFTDHDPFFLWAMKRGGFTWGGQFEKPDLHHFEVRKGLVWTANW